MSGKNPAEPYPVKSFDTQSDFPRRRIITLSVVPDGREILLEMPGNKPLKGWIEDLRRILELPDLESDHLYRYHLQSGDGTPLAEDLSLAQAGIPNSSALKLVAEKIPRPSEPVLSAEQGPDRPETRGEESARPETATDTQRGPLLLECASLLHPSGIILDLDPVPVVIGRAGKNSRPDIDLSEWDPKQRVSRRHAVIDLSAGDYVLRPEKTTNGTFLNGAEIPAGTTQKLQDGDRIQFGYQGMEFIFRLPVR